MKHKDPRYGTMLIRAILGCKKAINKLALFIPSDRSRKMDTHRKEVGIQCNERERISLSGDLDGIFHNPVDDKFLSDILQRLESLTNNKMTTRLIDIYRSLNRMYTEVPLPSEMPEMNSFEPDKIVDEIQHNLSEVHREIANYIAKRSLTRNKWEVGIQCDVRSDHEKEKEIMLNIAKEKELENLRLSNLIKKHLIEIDNLKDQVAKEQLRNNALEEQMNILDFSLRASRSKENKSQETAESAKNNLKETLKKFDEQMRIIRMFKSDLKTTESQMQKIYNTLLQWDDELYETKINYRIAEEKLKQIEKAYTEKVGNPFEYAPVTRDEIIRKFNILKRQFDFPWMGMLKQKQHEREAIDTGETPTKEDDFIHAYFESNRSSMQFSSDHQSSKDNSRKGSMVPDIPHHPYTRPQLSTSRVDVYSRKTMPTEFKTQDSKEATPTSSKKQTFKEDHHESGHEERYSAEYRGSNFESPDVSISGTYIAEKRVGTINRIIGREEEDSRYKFDRARYNPNDTLESVMEYGNMSTIESKVSLRNFENSESNCTVEIRELNTEEVLGLINSGKQLDDEEIRLIQRWIKKSYEKFASYLPPDLRKMFFTIRKVESKLELAKKAWYVSRNSKDTQDPIHGVGTITETSPLHFLSDTKERDPATTHNRRSKTTGPGGNLSRGSTSPFSATKRSPRSSVLEELYEGEHPSIRKLINKIMMGHDNRCGVECLHLKRAMALKVKYRGKPYPVNHTRIEYVEPPEIEEL
jgi:hypothetical protein